jgi:hypothetical protein
VGGRRQRNAWRQRQAGVAAQTALGRLPPSSALGSQAGVGVQRLHPWRVAAPAAALWFLIVKPAKRPRWRQSVLAGSPP